jgi:hypothetical protein
MLKIIIKIKYLEKNFNFDFFFFKIFQKIFHKKMKKLI